MPPPKYMELVVYRKAQGGLPMIKHTIKLSDLDLNALSIRDLMRDFIQKLRPNFEYLDSEIVYVKTGGGSVVGSDLFDEPAADLEQMIDSGDYDESIRDRAGQKKMGKIDRAFTCPKHTKFSDHGLEFMLCGEEGCDLCPRMPRVTKMGDAELTKEVLMPCPLPRLDADGKTFLPIDECQLLLDKGATLEEELADLKTLRGDFDKNDVIQKVRKARDTKLTKGINWTKVRKVLTCNDCGAPRCVFSRKAVSNKGGPQKKHVTALERFVEQNGFKCGDVVRIYADGKSDAERGEDADKEDVPLLFCRESHICGTVIESQYYAPSGDPQRGRRIVTKHLCCHCYSDCDMANKKDVQKKHNLGGKGFFPVCKHCLDDGVIPVFKKGRPNQLEKANEERQKKCAAKETRKRAKQS